MKFDLNAFLLKAAVSAVIGCCDPTSLFVDGGIAMKRQHNRMKRTKKQNWNPVISPLPTPPPTQTTTSPPITQPTSPLTPFPTLDFIQPPTPNEGDYIVHNADDFVDMVYNVILQENATDSMCNQIQIASNVSLYAHITDDDSTYLGHNPVYTERWGFGQTVAWLVSGEDSMNTLKSQCCGVTNITTCVNSYNVAMGEEPEAEPRTQWLYVFPEQEGNPVVQASWKNMASYAFNKQAFEWVFPDKNASEIETFMNNSCSSENLVILGNHMDALPHNYGYHDDTLGAWNTWSSFWKEDQTNGNKIMAGLGAADDGWHSIYGVTSELLWNNKDLLCKDIYAARTFMWYAFHTNVANLGTGFLEAAGMAEYVITTNMKKDEIKGLVNVTFPGKD